MTEANEENKDVLHIMRNIATKFLGVEAMHQRQLEIYEAQKAMIKSINEDWDRVWGILNERESVRKNLSEGTQC